jgi:5-methylcytosine-specific restriction endonuclease McrA
MGLSASQNKAEASICQASACDCSDVESMGQNQRRERRACQMESKQAVDGMGTTDSISLECRPTGKRSKSDISTKALLAMVLAQDYRCALSGRILTPDTASMDHRKPFAKGGTHELANVWIVDWRVNQAKGVMDPEEFIQMCGDVVAWQDRTQKSEENVLPGCA